MLPAATPPIAPANGSEADTPSIDVPRDTTPTFELEMLVSGAVLFGLFQLAGELEQWVHYWQPHVGLLGTFLVSGGGMLGRAALYGLIACFVTHLAIRAYWVALVGANSVFPGGPRWDRMRQLGPIQTELTRARVRPLSEFITRADNAASIVFASGFVIALSLTTAIVIIVPFALLVWALQRVLRMETALIVSGGIVLTLAVAQIGASLVDYQRKERLDPESRLGRAVRAALRFALSTSTPAVRSLWTVLMTNLSPKVAAAAMIAGAVILSAISISRSQADGGLPGASNFRFFSDGGPGALSAARYATLGAEPDTRGPWIDADVVTGPYLRLHIPYRPLVHDLAMPAACPDVRPLDFDDLGSAQARAATEAVLRCAARIHRIALDGRPLDSLRLRFLADPKANRRVFVAHVSVRGLAEGEHVLTVWPAVRPGRPAATAPYTIPFWR
ncbi:hypothetical protein [Roseisolibacter agri]|uniref:Uncharacterized protein n=1 Tax=Roseisolibacter agri TaxID=2014610 RepID=A0AA37V7C7_9BACT|nr:hypothetical protein [Roseisolibacter agri]GLC26441.1 hypothetical protein rosag_29540 [Roseisolibacter agri]